MSLDLEPPAALAPMLAIAVPMHARELRLLPFRVVLRIAGECGAIVAEKGDVIQFRSKKKGATALAFNALARGLACLSFAPGGVKFMGMHFEWTHPDSLSPEDIAELKRSLALGVAAPALALEFDLPVEFVQDMEGA